MISARHRIDRQRLIRSKCKWWQTKILDLRFFTKLLWTPSAPNLHRWWKTTSEFSQSTPSFPQWQPYISIIIIHEISAFSTQQNLVQEEKTRRLRFCWQTMCPCTAYESTDWTPPPILVITHCSDDSMTLRVEYSLLDKRAALTLLNLLSFTRLVFSNLLSTHYSLAYSFEAQVGWSRRCRLFRIRSN